MKEKGFRHFFWSSGSNMLIICLIPVSYSLNHNILYNLD